jgi:ribosome-binding ATPase
LGDPTPTNPFTVHTDFIKNFIAAEVVSYSDFIACSPTVKGFAEVKASGKYRTEGRSYIVADGDIIHFKIGVSGAGKK